MKIRIQFQGPQHTPKQRVLNWAQVFFLVASCLSLGYCAWVYFEAMVYQTFQGKVFENASRLGPAAPPAVGYQARAPIAEGSPLSRIEIPRLGVSVVVREGVRPEDLRLAAGHVPGTALPGESGNIGIAAHRDTFFRNLGQIRARDRITLTTLRGAYQYSVESTRVVDPKDVQVLQASGEPVLTLITCYPFYYVGSAPKRFIVRARQEAGP